MNGCMIAHASQKEEDAAREEWFATLDVRRREREALEAKKKEQEKSVAYICLGEDWLTREQILPRVVGPSKSEGKGTRGHEEVMTWKSSLL